MTGEIKSLEELQSVVAANKTLFVVYPDVAVGIDRLIHTIKNPQLDLRTKLLTGEFTNGRHSGTIDIAHDEVFGRDPRKWIFTNYWLAWAAMQKLLAKDRSSSE